VVSLPVRRAKKNIGSTEDIEINFEWTVHLEKGAKAKKKYLKRQKKE